MFQKECVLTTRAWYTVVKANVLHIEGDIGSCL